jgi:hypothetical protein
LHPVDLIDRYYQWNRCCLYCQAILADQLIQYFPWDLADPETILEDQCCQYFLVDPAVLGYPAVQLALEDLVVLVLQADLSDLFHQLLLTLQNHLFLLSVQNSLQFSDITQCYSKLTQ